MTAPGAPPNEESVVLVDGPWAHREVSANGARFHVAECGDGPLVLLLHGFPEFWWAWREQLVSLASAGFRAVAPDLRGYGASDKPPRGYDGFTLAADVAGLVRALGERSCLLVGHDWGGLIAWSVATVHPELVRGVAVLDTPHPLRLRAGLLADRRQRAAATHVFAFQTPRLAERMLTKDGAAWVGSALRDWSSPGWPPPDVERRFRDAMLLPKTAHLALEYYRWALRSLVRPDGARWARALRRGVAVPTLQLHGTLDPVYLPETAAGSGRWVRAPYTWRPLEGVGHFSAQEVPERVDAELLAWARGLPDDGSLRLTR
ncbi:MAG: alpha/beta hydrolase [Actinomycetota bacterium]|nr:alpha/beta hydrolase [Actinomycetota bacterium]